MESNLGHLQAQDFDSKAVWHWANTASGRSNPSALPAELHDECTNRKIKGEDRLADCIKKYYIEKIKKIRARLCVGDLEGLAAQQQQQH